MHAANSPTSDRLVAMALIGGGDEGPFLDPPEPKAVKRRFPWHLLVLLLLTGLAGASRFYRLDLPRVWGDEASSWRRVSGTYGQMLETLERDPFGPLFYSAEWAVRQYTPLTPFWLRFVPAVLGTLMIPAMYFLARQLCSIRTSLVAAILTLCSAWMINYSRDAKMYMTFWLFVTLSAGCCLWWLRTRTWTAWLCWIAASCAMMGANPWGAIILAFSAVWMLTAKRVHWAMGVGWVIGMIVILSGPVAYYQLFNHWRDKTEEAGHFSDIGWVGRRNHNQGGLDLVRDSTSAFLYSFTFIQEEENNAAPRKVLLQATVSLAAMLAVFAIGALPWRKATALPPPSSPETWWRPTLYLGLWLVVPTYLFYCISVKVPVSPSDWLNVDPARVNELIVRFGPAMAIVWAPIEAVVKQTWVFAMLAVAACVLLSWKPFIGRWLLGATLVAAAGTLLIAVMYAHASAEWRRPFEIINGWVALLGDWPFVSRMAVVIPAIAIARSSPTYRGRIGQIAIALLIAVAVYFVLAQIHTACVAAKQSMREGGVRAGSIWVPRYLGFIWPAVAIVAAAMMMRLPGWPVRWLAVIGFCAVNLYVAHHRVLGNTEPPLDRIIADIRTGGTMESNVRTYVQLGSAGGGPGGGTINSLSGKYYWLHNRTDLSILPDEVMNWQPMRPPTITEYRAPSVIANAVGRTPQIDRVIVWQTFHRDGRVEGDQDILRPDPNDDEVLRTLGSSWRRTNYEILPVLYHWSWCELYLYRRREYAKDPFSAVPTSGPASAKPSSRPAWQEQ